jgi:hypothetical protein
MVLHGCVDAHRVNARCNQLHADLCRDQVSEARRQPNLIQNWSLADGPERLGALGISKP